MKCLITGGAGFIGAHLVGYLLENTDWEIFVVDDLTYAALDGGRLTAFYNNPRFTFYCLNVTNLGALDFDMDYIVHMAAETHVVTSIKNPLVFVEANVLGTFQVLQYARRQPALKTFLYFSTDEVFGSAAAGEIRNEDAPYRSGNPYAATKAAGEELALAWGNTYGIPVVVSHCCNVFGPLQHEEKFIPKLVQKILDREKISIHADASGEIGSRMYVHAGDVARAVKILLESGGLQEKYNIPGIEISNLDMARHVAFFLDKELLWEKIRPDDTRPGWDFAYRISGEKLQALGWSPSPDFYIRLNSTVESYARTSKSQK